MSKAGWYPDPGGQAGMYRYWDGATWSPVLSPTPTAPAPATGGFAPSGQPARGSQPIVLGQAQPNAYAPRGTGQPGGGIPQLGPAQPQQSNRGGVIGLVIGAIVLLALIALVATQAFKGGGLLGGGTSGGQAGQAEQNVCPKPRNVQAAQHPADGRVHGGKLSYPTLGSPWESPKPEYRLPFGIDAHEQIVTVEENYAPKSSWVASVLVAELNAGDGFHAAKDGAEIVAKCVLGAFYGDNPVQRQDVSSQAVTVDGHEGWALEMHLSFDIKNLKTKGETALIVVVDTGDLGAGLYYASIPDTTPQLLGEARRLVDQLQVD